VRDLYALADWRPPASWSTVDTIDAHTEGEPFRVILSGFPEPRGATMLERRRDLADRHDHLRRAIMLEPRGHADMYGCLVTAPASPDGHLGVLFMHNEGYSTMCGHGIIGLATVLTETGYFVGAPPDPIRIDTPAGRVEATVQRDSGGGCEVSFRNVGSFVLDLDATVSVDGIGAVTYDLAFGGAFYAYVQAASIGLSCRPAHTQALIDAGRRIKRAVTASRSIEHPTDPDLGFLYGVIFIGSAEMEQHHSRHVGVFADGEVDRSPTGTGVSGRLALLYSRRETGADEYLVIESILGSRFGGRIVAETRVGPYPAIVAEVSGRAFLTGRHRFFLDPRDPFREGFFLR
jgi:trans-L-3-hydroxyproline dehydratase